MYNQIENEIFHVHTWRCGHASEEQDYQYVEKTISLGASRIVFTDHCPFPGNPFGSRMGIEQLPEYLQTLMELKEKYQQEIEIMIGLEAEYLPSFHEHYIELKNMKELDLLILGQHMYEHENRTYSFGDIDKSNEHIGLCEAIISGIHSGDFDVVAHPDRSFRRCKKWTIEMQMLSRDIINAAQLNNVLLEKNYSSMRHKQYFWPEFWGMVAEENILYGYDAHAVEEIENNVIMKF